MHRNVSPAGAVGVALVAVMSLTACETSDRLIRDDRTRGMVVGGATGAAVGSIFGAGSGKAVAIGAGAVLGAIAGGEIATR